MSAMNEGCLQFSIKVWFYYKKDFPQHCLLSISSTKIFKNKNDFSKLQTHIYSLSNFFMSKISF